MVLQALEVHPQQVPLKRLSTGMHCAHVRALTAVLARPGPEQSSSTQERTEFPDLPRGPDDMSPEWFLDLYKSDKTLVRTVPRAA